MTLKEDSAFEAFVSQAKAIAGTDCAREFLLEVWTGADGDVNRALNHVLDSPPELIRREGHSSNKPSKKSAKKVEARAWEDDTFGAFPPAQQQREPTSMHQQQQYQQPSQQQYQQPQQPQQQFQSQQQPPSQSMMGMVPQVAPNQQMQTQQLQQLVALKMALDNVVANPGMIQNPLVMKNLKDTMLHAMEVPDATLILSNQAKKSEASAKSIAQMQARVSKMLADPKISHNADLLDNLNDQMNQLRLMSSTHLAEQQQLLQLSQTATPAQLLLLRPGRNGDSESEDLSTGDEMDLEWWEKKRAKKQARSSRHVEPGSPVMSQNNPFKDEEGEKRRSPSRVRISHTSSVPNLSQQIQPQQMQQPQFVIMQQPMTSQLMPHSGPVYYTPQQQQQPPQWQHPY